MSAIENATENLVLLVRHRRQARINAVVARLFGARFLTRRGRVERLIEETAELAQALDFPEEDAVRVVRLAYAGRKGVVAQEVGGVAVCLLSLCEVEGMSADACERVEIERLELKNPEELAAKLAAKIAAGIVTEDAA